MQFKPLALLGAAAIAALIAAGCAKGGDQSSATASSASSAQNVPTAAKPPGAAEADAVHGKTVFAKNCAQCHAADGGIGPALKNEKSRKNYAQTVAWIKNPQPPMAKLFPGVISEKDVADVAAYVQTL